MRPTTLLLIVASGCTFPASNGNGTDPADASTTTEVDARPRDAQPPDAPTDAAPPPPDARHCGANYAAVAGSGTTSTYRVVNPVPGQASFSVAVATCGFDGAHLLITETLVEAAALWTHIAGQIPGTVGTDEDTGFYRVGVSRLATTSPWIDVLLRPFTPPAWGDQEPTNGGDNQSDLCLLLGEGGEHWDWNCTADQEFACECE